MEKYNALLLWIIFACVPMGSLGANSNLFGEYIGALFTGVKLADVPVDEKVKVNMILAFAIDYTTGNSPSPTDGHFNIFWDSDNISPQAVQAIKTKDNNVKVALSLGGDSVGNSKAYFNPSSVSSWVKNAVSSLTKLITQYHLDGIDIDYEHFKSDPDTFVECVGQLISTLKKNKVISFASIAPFDDDQVQSHYTALWKKYGNVIDYVNFQFYAYDSSTTVSQFIKYYNAQKSRYSGGKVLVSFTTEGSRGLSPANGFFDACKALKKEGNLEGIFVWCADSSAKNGFKYEKQSQALLKGS